jgi:hypothetical protein
MDNGKQIIEAYNLVPSSNNNETQPTMSTKGGSLRLVRGGDSSKNNNDKQTNGSHERKGGSPMKQHGEQSSSSSHLGQNESKSDELCQGLNELKGHLDNHIKEHEGMSKRLSQLMESSQQCIARGGDTLYQVTGGQKGEPLGMERDLDDTIVCSRDSNVFVRFRQNMRATLNTLLKMLEIDLESSLAYRLHKAVRQPGQNWDSVRDQIVELCVLAYGLPELNRTHQARCQRMRLDYFDPCTKTRPYLLATARSMLEDVMQSPRVTADTLYDGLANICETIFIYPYVQRVLYNFCISCDVPAESRMSLVDSGLYNMILESPQLRESMHSVYLMKNYLCDQYNGLHDISEEFKERLENQFAQRVCALVSQSRGLTIESVHKEIQTLFSKICRVLEEYNVKWSDIMRPEMARIGYPFSDIVSANTTTSTVSAAGGLGNDDDDDDEDDEDDNDNDSQEGDDDADEVRRLHEEIFRQRSSNSDEPSGGEGTEQTLYDTNGDTVRLPSTRSKR